MTDIPVVLAISGLDPTGSAGLIADCRVLEKCECHPVGVVSCQTVQTSDGMSAVYPSDANILREQLKNLSDDMTFAGIKIGALASSGTIQVIGEFLADLPDVPVVLDPVVNPTSGVPFLNSESVQILVGKVIPKSFLITPNLSELVFLSGRNCESDAEISEAAAYLIEKGVKNVLVTGLDRDEKIIDRLYATLPDFSRVKKDFIHPRIETENVHGTGCVLSSAIAASIARGDSIFAACNFGIAFTMKAIQGSVKIGKGSRFWRYL